MHCNLYSDTSDIQFLKCFNEGLLDEGVLSLFMLSTSCPYLNIISLLLGIALSRHTALIMRNKTPALLPADKSQVASLIR